jgi:hypothetical protein
MDDIVVIRVLEEDEDPPHDAVEIPALKDMEPEEAVRRLMDVWGLDEADARFHLALARGETDGDTHAIDDNGQRVRKPRQHHTTV